MGIHFCRSRKAELPFYTLLRLQSLYSFFTGPFDATGFFVVGLAGFGFFVGLGLFVGLGFVGVFGISVALAILSSGFIVGEAATAMAKRVSETRVRNCMVTGNFHFYVVDLNL